ncbi:GntR family transcriptional regulator [Cecembia calidifontis]|nr:GntR family transcriptional regulator [Cecembia calidifontis]
MVILVCLSSNVRVVNFLIILLYAVEVRVVREFECPDFLSRWMMELFLFLIGSYENLVLFGKEITFRVLIFDPMKLHLAIEENSSVPKYIQIVKAVKSLLTQGKLRYGDKIPSINLLSADYSLSRDTVEKAYRILKKQGIIESVKGKGYYISHHSDLAKYKILLLFNKLSAYKQVVYNALVTALKDRADISFHVFHCEFSLFKKYLEQFSGQMDYYIIMPHFKKDQESMAAEMIKNLPQEKLILLDKCLPFCEGVFGSVYQEFKEDIYQALVKLSGKLTKYHKLYLAFPSKASYPYPAEILQGFKKFAVEFQKDFEVIEEIGLDKQLVKGEAYIVIEENDLVNLIKKANKTKGLIIGKNLGILSYNETPLKEVLLKGITVISSDFPAMGKLTAEMILRKEGKMIKNEFKVIERASL